MCVCVCVRTFNNALNSNTGLRYHELQYILLNPINMKCIKKKKIIVIVKQVHLKMRNTLGQTLWV